MPQTKYTYSIFTDTLNNDLEAAELSTSISASAIVTNIDYISALGDVLDIYFQDALSAGDETILTGLVNAHAGTPAIVKIHSFAKEEAKDKHPHNINYKTELTQSLHPKRTFAQGELQKVEWFSDSSATNKVLEVDIVYTRDSLGFALSRITTRKWFRDDDTEFNELKITDKVYTLNYNDQIVEGKKRRRNIVDGVQIPVMGFLIEVLAPLTQGEIVLIGRDFLDRMEPFFQRFVENSSSINDAQDPNFGKKEIVVEFENATDSWMDSTPTPLGGVITIRQYLISEFSI